MNQQYREVTVKSFPHGLRCSSCRRIIENGEIYEHEPGPQICVSDCAVVSIIVCTECKTEPGALGVNMDDIPTKMLQSMEGAALLIHGHAEATTTPKEKT